MGIKHDASYRSGENMAKKTDEELYDVAINMIGSVAKLPVTGGALLVAISVVLTMIGGLIPSRVASKKDPVEALRSE